ncbi:MAG: molybdopterin-dependent oxidoreductase, partial [Armatimonadetes bacterium]|nr:molybdopterin-dependent oxidoreductase [Armatimonadota bacterium]
YITGIPVADIEKLAHEFGTIKPACIRLNYGLQRHGGGGMAVRTITCLPALIGSWRLVGGGALLSTSKLYPFDNAALERPDLIPPGTRTINMNELPQALLGELPGPPVRALFIYNANPAAVNPDQGRVLLGLRRDDLFTVVHDQFQTDSANYADVVLPATTQLEHFDLHGSYGHFHVQTNEPAIAPLGESKSNTDVFRLLARRMNFEPDLFDVSDEDLAKQALGETESNGSSRFPFTLDRLRREGPLRLDLPKDHTPFATGNFPTRSGKCELYSQSLADQGLDPLPTYTPPHEDPQTRPDLAGKYPLQMLSPPKPEFLNSTFVNIDSLRRDAGGPTVEIHPDDAAPRGIEAGAWMRVFNDRGSYLARALVGAGVKRGVVVCLGTYWSRWTKDGANVNATTSTALTDFGGGATFFDNLVEVAPLEARDSPDTPGIC